MKCKFLRQTIYIFLLYIFILQTWTIPVTNATNTSNEAPGILNATTIHVAVTKVTPADFARSYEDARLISLAAGACAGTYKNKTTALEYEYLGEYGWEIYPQVINDQGITANFMIATHPHMADEDSMGIIAFRGSSSLGDWKQNFKFDQVNYGGSTPEEFKETMNTPAKKGDSPKIHRGFAEYVQTAFKLKTDLNTDGKDDEIIDLLKQHPQMKVLITGHSLGGAAATLYAERLVAMGVHKDQVPVVTFGAPAIGNEAFAKEYGNKIYLLRVRNTHDLVPKVLYAVGRNYTQFGKEIVFPLSNKYSDMSHPISLYYDYAVKYYYDTLDKGISLGYKKAIPNSKLQGTAPLIAVAVRPLGKQSDPRYTPNLLRYISQEYKSILPRYVFITNYNEPSNSDDLQNLIKTASQNKASYLLVLEAGLKPIKQTDRFYATLNQAVFNVPDGTLVTMGANGSHVTYDKGIVQTTMTNLLNCEKELEAKLPFLNHERAKVW